MTIQYKDIARAAKYSDPHTFLEGTTFLDLYASLATTMMPFNLFLRREDSFGGQEGGCGDGSSGGRDWSELHVLSHWFMAHQSGHFLFRLWGFFGIERGVSCFWECCVFV